ncbi:Uncharacterised protein [Legionella beliardensis]|uniref:Uncharacterized protein n=1 Tax=Legionella beliardensis TaxID=91822 RepID=A0A378I034_9GAMM|nr:hypothetical protein [Legionella beliardensis]STX28558.1 Uncharacterised protein [Legionella beliardensis]
MIRRHDRTSNNKPIFTSSPAQIASSLTKGTLSALVNSFLEEKSKAGSSDLLDDLVSICHESKAVRANIRKKLLPFKQHITFLNTQYLHLIPLFYLCLEQNDSAKAKLILKQILELNIEFDVIVQSLITQKLSLNTINPEIKDLILLEEYELNHSAGDILATTVGWSYHLHKFPQNSDSKAELLYEQFLSIFNQQPYSILSSQDVIDDVFDNLLNNYSSHIQGKLLSQQTTVEQIIDSLKIHNRPADKPNHEVGLTLLSRQEITPAQNRALQNAGHPIHKAILDFDNPESNTVFFSVIDNHPSPILVITTPLAANAREANFSFAEALNAIKLALAADDLNNFHVIAPLVGEGVTEGHITTLYRPAAKLNQGKNVPAPRFTCFDSKIGDIRALVTSPNTSGGQRQLFTPSAIYKAAKGLMRSLFSGSFSKEGVNFSDNDKVPQELKTINYVSLGTQSFFDGYSCGFHHLSNSLNMIALIQKEKEVNRQNLLSKNDETNPLLRSTDLLNSANIKVHNSFSDFLKKAWQETFLPDMTDEQRKQTNFAEYFLGWPAKNGLVSKIAYVVFFGWLFTPLKNMVKLSTELLMKVVSESINYLKHQVYAIAPTSVSGQVVRSMALIILNGLHALAEGARLLIRTVTSPIVSAQAGWNKHPLLGLLSVTCTLAALVGLSIVASPVMAIVSAKLGIAVGLNLIANVPILPQIAYPILWVLGKLGIAATPTLIGAATLSMLSTAATLINGIRESFTKAPPTSSIQAGSVIPDTSKQPSIERSAKDSVDNLEHIKQPNQAQLFKATHRSTAIESDLSESDLSESDLSESEDGFSIIK